MEQKTTKATAINIPDFTYLRRDADLTVSGPVPEPSVQLCGHPNSGPAWSSPTANPLGDVSSMEPTFLSASQSTYPRHPLASPPPYPGLESGFPYFGPPAIHAGYNPAMDQTYRCCLGTCCHVTTCTYIIGILEFIGLIIGLIISITEYQIWRDPIFYRGMLVCIITFIVGTVIIVILFYGVYKVIPALLLPHMVFQSLSIAGFCCGVVWYAVTAVAYGTDMSNSDWINDENLLVFWSMIVVIVVCSISLVIQLCFVMQVIKCYRYLKVKARLGRR